MIGHHQIRVALPLLVVIALLMTGCTSAPEQRSFATPEAGADALVSALSPYNESKVRAILGPGSEEVLSSGDPIADRENRAEFASLYKERHGIVRDGEEIATVVVGETDWPLPIPLVRDEAKPDSWRFDAELGREELLSRRIGRNELSAIEVSQAIVDAQHEYAARDDTGARGGYARWILSKPGSRDGLYWETGPSESPSPLGALVARAESEGYTAETQDGRGQPRPYHGYLYRILAAQGDAAPGGAMDYVEDGRLTGGFAVIASPAIYGNSGIMTFMTGPNGIVYQRDLGPDTAGIAAGIVEFNPDLRWTVLKDPLGLESPISRGRLRL